MWDGFTGDTIYLDTNIVILSIETGNPWRDSLQSLFVSIDERAVHAVTSELTLAEVLTKPLVSGDAELIDKYERLFAPSSPIKSVPVDRSVLCVAAQCRSDLGLKLIDAIHVATARLSGCEFFLTQDERLGRSIREPLRWIRLSEAGGVV